MNKLGFESKSNTVKIILEEIYKRAIMFREIRSMGKDKLGNQRKK
tara:strand:+ start:1652 stop:1786 length:135 start_codon:yes stop_codon:yes gene_type:complete